ncbi:MAG: hypothetical protein ACREQI_00945 [Candidatus Binataceae bacterium]
MRPMIKAKKSRRTRGGPESEQLELRVTPSVKRMELTAVDRKVFLGAILNPSKPTARLIAAMKRHRRAVLQSASTVTARRTAAPG